MIVRASVHANPLKVARMAALGAEVRREGEDFDAAKAAARVWAAARGAPSMADSLREGRVVETARADTIADGIAVRVPVPEALADLRGLVDAVLRVDDADNVTGMRLAFLHVGLLLEPSGAVGLAALVAHRARFEGTRCATVLCGGNLADADRAALLAGADGR